MINNKTKLSDYKALTDKERKQIKEWFSSNKKKKSKSNNVKKPKNNKQNLDVMADKLKGKPYSVFLKSEYWHIIRNKVLKRDNYTCVICKSKSRLQTHHDTYKHHFREHRHLKDLLTLCASCHRERHYCTD